MHEVGRLGPRCQHKALDMVRQIIAIWPDFPKIAAKSVLRRKMRHQDLYTPLMADAVRVRDSAIL